MKKIGTWNLGFGTSRIALTTFMTLFAMALVISGCASSPDTTFITLASVDSGQNLSNKTDKKVDSNSIYMQVGKVTLPAALDRLALVKQVSKTQVNIQETVKWIAPLKSLIKQTLTDDLTAHFPEKTILPQGALAGDNVHIFIVNISKFSANKDNKITLNCYWSLVDNKTEKPIKSAKISITSQAKSSSPTAIAQAMSEAISKLSVAIAKSM